ncbi:MAG: hypothetical protein LBH92_05940 [Bacteroidales bacterium]|jgi:hypothetical protein|nr:hypothetical protein [Bacteroidales bacterium]
MKNLKILLAFLSLFSISSIAFGQGFTLVKTIPEYYYGPSLNDPVTVNVVWERENGIPLEENVTTTVGDLSRDGVKVYIPASTPIYSPIIATKIVVAFYGQTHIGIYSGFAATAIREDDPQNWVIVP